MIADHRHDLVVERTRAQNRLRWHLVEPDRELETSLKRGVLADEAQLDLSSGRCAGTRSTFPPRSTLWTNPTIV